MWSPGYNYAWGCRCCAADGEAGGDANENWNVYSYGAAPTPTAPTPAPTAYCDNNKVDCSSICEWELCSTFFKYKAQCEFTGSCQAQAEVGLEAAEIAGIACCAVLICILLAGYCNRRRYASKGKNTPAPTSYQPGAESAVLPTPMIQVIAAPAAAVVTPASADPIAALLKLKGLLDAGAITQVEFDAKKASQLAQV
jgi:hypothetical protein